MFPLQQGKFFAIDPKTLSSNQYPDGQDFGGANCHPFGSHTTALDGIGGFPKPRGEYVNAQRGDHYHETWKCA